MNEHSSFVELMCARAMEHGDQTALVFSADPFRPERDEILTYRSLDQAARRVAALLQARFAPGDRVLVLQPTGLGFASSFLGCVYAGMVPVAAPPPDGHRRQADRIAAIARDADAVAALADTTDMEALTTWAKEQDLPGLALLDPSSEQLPPAAAWRRPPADPDALVFLQYTSGSTSDPKGVMVDHANLLANARLLALVLDLDSATVAGGWLPMHHDFGLIGLLLTPLILGGRSVLMPPMAFLKRPNAWLTLIDRHGIDFSCGPELRVRAGRPAGHRRGDRRTRPVPLAAGGERRGAGPCLDPRGVRPAVRGGGSVPDGAAARLRHGRDDPGGLRRPARPPPRDHPGGPGRARTRRAGAARRRLDGATARELWPRRGARHHRRRPRLRPDAAGRAGGEIWVRGPNVARGYWRRPEETALVFDVTTADGDPGYLRTGDLGILHEGELYVTGRIKELIIVRGRNLYPQDLEAVTRTAHPALERGVGAAFSVPVPEEEVVIVRECRERDPAELARVAEAVRDRLSREYGVNAQGIVLVRPGRVARTTSGKIQRRLVREQFLRGDLTPVHAELSPSVRANLPAVKTGRTAS